MSAAERRAPDLASLDYRDGTAVLGPGDSVSFSSAAAHRYRPLGGDGCTAVLVITSTR